MAKTDRSAAKGCGILAAFVVGVPLLVIGVVGFQTWVPLLGAGDAIDELDRSLGQQADYVPAASGEIPAGRMEIFLELRAALVTACDDYGTVRRGFESVESLETKEPGDLGDVGEVTADLGAASLQITPFLARFFERRNQALLSASMSLQEYSYIYAAAYHDLLLSPGTRAEIFSDGEALSPEASGMLQACLARQLEEVRREAGNTVPLVTELRKMADDPARLIWQDGLPEALAAGVMPFRNQLDRVFCGATAGLEMERSSGRALRIALE